MRKSIARLPWIGNAAQLVHGYLVIRTSGLFDSRWYRHKHSEARWHPSPIFHYLVRGARQGCDPHPLFDTAWYLKMNKDVSAAGMNPLVHFLQRGTAEKRNPNHLFDTAWYLSLDHHGAAAASNPLGHYLKVGWKEGKSPHPEFDTHTYLEVHRDVYESKMNPLVHYRQWGLAEGRQIQAVGYRSSSSESVGNARGARSWKVVVISGEPHTPGHVYRVEMLAKALELRGHEIRILAMTDLTSGCHELDAAHALVIWRAPYTEQIAHAVAQAWRLGIKIVFDVDDLMFDPALAKIEVIDGIRSQGLEEAQTADFYRSIQRTMLAADYCICPTNRLAREMRRFQKATFVLPNGFDERTCQQSRKAVAERRKATADGLIRIGYAGGSRTHQRDFRSATPALARLLREFPECRLVLFRYEGGTDKLPCVDLHEFPELNGLEASIEWRRLVPLRDLPFELARFDINIAPLETGNVFCEAKSALKYFEAALVEVPTVASPTAPFVDAMRNGVTGYLAEGREEWYAALKALVTQPELRSRMGRDAYLDVLWRYGPERRAELAACCFEQIIEDQGPAAAASFALQARRATEPRRSLPVLPEYDIKFQAGSPAQSQVAVVIPLYNYAEHVVEALDSVRSQTVPAKELVIVEDCSTDDSLQIALKWLKQNAGHFTYVALLQNRKNSGLALTRNAGFAFTDARFVLALDPDNRILPNFLKRCQEVIVLNGAAAVYATIQEFGDGSGKRSAENWKPQRFIGGNYIDAMALIRRSAWAAVGGYQHMKVMGWEDYDLWCRFVEDGHWGAWIPETLAEYRVHNKSMLMTHTDTDDNRRILIEEMHALHPWMDRDALAGLPENTEPIPPAGGAPLTRTTSRGLAPGNA